MTFNGFISYSHAADGRLAPAIQRGLHRLAKPWHRRRALWIFRDQTGLAVTPGLWSSIQKALDGSDWFVLLASPEAARSRWVNREIEHWIGTKSVDRILPVVTDGQWQWDPVGRDFTEGSTAVPPALRGVFAEEPLFLDLRWARDDLQLSLRHSRFRDAIAQLAAPMHGVSKDDLEGEDVRQHRRMRRMWSVAAAALLVLALVASLAGGWAVRSAQRANTASAEAGHQQRVAAQHKSHAENYAEQARVQQANARTQQKRATDAAAEAERQEANARTQGENARKQGENARKESENARLQQELADRAAARAREQERLAREQRAAAQRSAGDARRQRQLAQEQERLAQQAAQDARRQKQIAQDQQRRAEEAGAEARRQERNALDQQRRADQARAEARRQEQIALDQQRRADEAGSEARRQEQIALTKQREAEAAAEEARTEKANAAQQQRIAIGRRLTNKARALVETDPRTAARLAAAAVKLQADDEARRQVAGLVTSTQFAGALDNVDAVGYLTNDVLLTKGRDDKLKLWNVANPGKPTFIADLGTFPEWAISPDGRTVAAAGTDKPAADGTGKPMAVLLDVSTPSSPKVAADIPVSSQVHNVTFSQDGRTLFVGAWDERAKDAGDLWNVTKPRQPQRLATRFDGGSAPVFHAAFSPNGKTLVIADQRGSTGVWDLTRPARAQRVGTLDEALTFPEPAQKERVLAMAFLRDAPILVTGGEESTVLIDLSTPAAPKRANWIGNEGGTANSVIISSDGHRLVIGGHRGLARVFDLASIDPPVQVASVTDPGWIDHMAMSPDGRTVVTVSSESTATQWNVAAHGAPQLWAHLADGDQQGVVAAFTPDGRSMVTVGDSPQAAVWDMTGAAPVRRDMPPVHDGIFRAAITPDGRTVATVDFNRQVRVVDLANPARPTIVAEFVDEEALLGRGDQVAISPDGATLAVGNTSGTAVLWDVTRGRTAKRLGQLPGGRMPLAFSPVGRTLAVTDMEESLSTLDASASLWTLGGPDGPARLGELGKIARSTIHAIAFSVDGKTVAIGGGTIGGLWDISEARPRPSGTFNTGGSFLEHLVFSRDGQTLAAMTVGELSLWDVGERSEPVRVAAMSLETQRDSTGQTATFSRDGRFLVTSEPDTAGAKVWDLTKLAELRADPGVQACVMAGGGLTEDEWARYVPELPYQPTCPG